MMWRGYAVVSQFDGKKLKFLSDQVLVGIENAESKIRLNTISIAKATVDAW